MDIFLTVKFNEIFYIQSVYKEITERNQDNKEIT